jgi:type IV secretory pathway VirB10-like protein
MARKKKIVEPPIEDTAPVTGADDNFGLPDIDYKPLDRTEPAPEIAPEPVQEVEQPVAEEKPTYTYETSSYAEASEPGSLLPRVFAIALMVALALGATWYFAVYRPNVNAEEKALQEKRIKDKEEAERKRLAEEQRLAEERRLAAEAAANAKPTEGSIETLTDRTQRYYVVAASSIDADLVMDFARKLSAKGVTCKIIPPYGKVKFSRLTIADGDTFAAAQAQADALKAEYTDALWVIKY